MNEISLSVSIVVYDLDKSALNRCITSLCNALQQAIDDSQLNSWHITLVDNGNNEIELSEFASADVTITQTSKNLGYGSGHNQAILESASDYHLILNPDVYLDSSVISKHLTWHFENPDTVLSCPKGVSEYGQNLYLCKRYPTLLVLFLRGASLSGQLGAKSIADYEYHDLSDTTPEDVLLVSGCCMFARTDTLKSVGGFDTRYFMYFEDFDLSLKLAEFGRIVYLPDSVIEHSGGNTARKGWKHILMFARSCLRFFRSHGWRFV